jgi:hypothetical protein
LRILPRCFMAPPATSIGGRSLLVDATVAMRRSGGRSLAVFTWRSVSGIGGSARAVLVDPATVCPTTTRNPANAMAALRILRASRPPSLQSPTASRHCASLVRESAVRRMRSVSPMPILRG